MEKVWTLVLDFFLTVYFSALSIFSFWSFLVPPSISCAPQPTASSKSVPRQFWRRTKPFSTPSRPICGAKNRFGRTPLLTTKNSCRYLTDLYRIFFGLIHSFSLCSTFDFIKITKTGISQEFYDANCHNCINNWWNAISKIFKPKIKQEWLRK